MSKNRAIIHEAQQVANLLADPTYTAIMDAVRTRQADVMLNPVATVDELAEAHSIIRALNEIDNYTRGVYNLAVVEDRKPA